MSSSSFVIQLNKYILSFNILSNLFSFKEFFKHILSFLT